MSGNLRATGLEITGSVDISSDLRVTGSSYFSDEIQTTGDVSLLANSRLRFNNPGQNDQFIYGNDSTLYIDSDDTLLTDSDSATSIRVGSYSALYAFSARTVMNHNQQDKDFSVSTSGKSGTLFVDAADHSIILGHEEFDSSPASSEAPGYGDDVKIMLSGSIDSKNGSTRGVVLAPGDMVISGAIHSGRLISLEDQGSYVKVLLDNVEIQSNQVVKIQHRSGEANTGDDTNFFVSGSLDSRGTSAKGTSVFGGDLVVSGTVYNRNGVAIGGKTERHIKYNNFSLNHNTLELFWPGSDGESANTTIPFNQLRGFMAPYSGSISKIQIRGQTSNTSNVYRFYTSPGAIDNPPVPVGHFSGSGETANQATEYDIANGQKRFKGGATSAQTYTGNFNFDPGDLITISYQVIAGVAPGNVNVAIHLDYNTTSIIE